MRLSSIVIQSLLATVVSAARGKKFRRDIEPEGPTDPGITSKCTYYDTWFDDYIRCDLWLSDWAITSEQFTEYNPTVGDNCSGIKADHSYCVEINHGRPEASSTEIPEPEPTDTQERYIFTQEGLIGSCIDLRKASEGDTCAKIVSDFGTFDLETFFKWNPAVGKDCSALWPEYYYCVGVPETPKTTAAATEPSGSKMPTILQKGLIKGWSLFHRDVKDETCADIVSSFNSFQLQHFL